MILNAAIALSIAQTTTETVEAPPPQTVQAKKIVVTGSYIKRIDEEGPSAVKVLDKKALEKSGLNSVGDVLRDEAVITSVGRESSGGSDAGTSSATLRAFGSDSILVLLNGLRLPKIGGGNSVDLNLIPISALERVEVLKDGASALYGSDAVGGVINFITKKDYNTSDFSINYSLPEEPGGNRFDIVGSSGISTDKYSIMGVVQYRNNKGIKDKDRYFSKMDNIFTDGSVFSSPGTFSDGTTGDLTPLEAGCTLNDFGFCAFDFTQYSTGLPDLEQINMMVSGRYKISDNLEISTSQILTHRDVNWVYAPAPDRIPVTAAQMGAWGIPVANDGEIYYRLVEELGIRNNDNTTNSYTSQVALEGKFAPTWDWELSGVYGTSRTDEVGTGGYASIPALKNLIGTGGFNPTLPSGSKSDLSSAAWVPTKDTTTTQSSVRFVTSTPLYNGGDYFGPIAMAVGTSADWQDYRSRVDALTASVDAVGKSNLFGGSGSNGSGQRNSQAVFTELNLFPIDDVEVGLAARYDKFSDFGETFNPKISLSWQATPKFMFRSSFGTGFRAPNLEDLYSGESFGFPTFIDRKQCDAGVPGACRARQYQFNTRGNPNLQEETSVFYNLGFVAQPKKNWNITVDGWAAQLKDQVNLSLNDIMVMESRIDAAQGAGAGATSLNNQYGIIIVRDPGTGRLISVDATSINVGTSFLSGVDMGFSHEGNINIAGKGMVVRTAMEHTQFLRRSNESFPGIGVRFNRDIFWKNTLSSAVSFDNNVIRVGARSIAGGDKNQNEAGTGITGFGSLPFYTEYDLTYSYNNFYGGTISAGIRNVFNAKRPIDDTVQVPSRLNTSQYDPIGRAFTLGFNRSF
jgi:iron complex outermembrane recepter protein